MQQIKLNLSGHENQVLKAEGFVDVPSPHVNLNDASMYAKLTEYIEPYVQGASEVCIVLPKLQEIAVALVIIIHGLTGRFPNVVRLRRDSDGEYRIAFVQNLHALRNNVARTRRKLVVVL